jgi:hypothetical protein
MSDHLRVTAMSFVVPRGDFRSPVLGEHNTMGARQMRTLIWVAIGIGTVVAVGVAANMTGNGGMFGAVLLMAIFSAAYMLPTIIAVAAHARLVGPVVVVNLFLGWTFIGWVVALAMAVGGSGATPRGQAGLPRGQAGLPPAGWYPDPAGSGGQRYWNGQQWSNRP